MIRRDEPARSERWVSVEDVAHHLGVAKDSVHRWIETRSRPAHKIGRLWKFQLSEVDEWVRSAPPTAGAPSRRSS